MTTSLQKEKASKSEEHVATHDSIETQSSADSTAVHILRQVFRITGKSETAETLRLWVFDTDKENTPLSVYAERIVSGIDTMTIDNESNKSSASRKLSTQNTHEEHVSSNDKLVQLDEVTCTGKAAKDRTPLYILLLLLILLIICVLYKLIQRIRQ